MPRGPLCPLSGLPFLQEFLGCTSPSALGVGGCPRGAPAQRPVPAGTGADMGYLEAERFYPRTAPDRGFGHLQPPRELSDLLEWGLQFLPVVQGVLGKKGEAETLCCSFKALESPGVTALG